MRKSPAGVAGFTMVEVMISMAVLAFVLLAFLGVMQASATMSASSKESSIAAFQLQAAMEATFAMPFDEFKTVFDPALVPDPGDVLDHAGLDPKNRSWRGHLGSRPSGSGNPSRLPDFCQSQNLNQTWRPIVNWVGGPRLPLLNQHLWVEWTNQGAGAVDWVEYRLTITWTNYRGRPQEYSIVTRRSR